MPPTIRDRNEELRGRERYLAWKAYHLPRLVDLQERMAAGETFEEVARVDAQRGVVRRTTYTSRRQ